MSRWADTYRYLSPETAAEPGRWRTARVPYLREIMDCVSDWRVPEIVFMAAAQISKTEGLINNAVAYFLHSDPSPVLAVFPTLDVAKGWSQERLAPMLRDTPALAGLIVERAKDDANAIFNKSFPGGHLAIVGSNAAAGLAMRPRRVLLLDEIDRFAASAGAEGDPIALARARTKTFGARRKIIQTSTPTVKGKSRIAKLYFDDSDQRQYYVPCPDCGEFQTLRWANLIFDPAREGADAEYLCDFCGVLLPHAAKPEMLARGEWRAARQFAGVAGFWLNELYSPWVSWREMAAAFLRAKDDPQQLQAFVNTSLAELWEAEEDQAGRQVAAGDVAALREDYPPDVEAPDGVLVLTAGVDVQDDRLEIEVVGWGRDEESWSVDYRILYGSPAEPEVWRELLSVLSGEYRHADGAPIKIRAAGIDTGGHHTQDVYRFVQANAGRGVFALKGASVPAAQLVGGPSRPHGKIRVKLFTVGVDTAKEQLMARLRLIEPGPGYCHFPAWYDEEFFAQLTAEKLVDRYEKGRRIRKWVKTRARNEALDCRIYAAATLAILYPRPRWPQLAEGRAGLARQQEPSAGVAGQRPAAASFVPQRGGSGFLGGGRGNFLGGLR